MSNRADLLMGIKNGNLIETICKLEVTNLSERNSLALELVALHNEGLVDVIKAFEALTINLPDGSDYFLAQYVFAKALADINAPVPSVIRCVFNIHRYECENQVFGTGTIEGLIAYCGKESSRVTEAIAIIEANPQEFSGLLPAILIAGSGINIHYFLAEAIRLCGENNEPAIRKQALFSIGKLNWGSVSSVPDSVYGALEGSIRFETDDEILANIIRSAFGVFQHDNAQESRIATLILSVLDKGGDYTIHAASEIFGFNANDLPSSLLEKLFVYLARVNPINSGTLRHIDYGISQLLKNGETDTAIQFLETLLLAQPNELAMEVFSNTANAILNNNALMNKVCTRWFQKGDRILCEGLHTIIGEYYLSDPLLEIDSSELKSSEYINIIFVARKAIGYLFMKPISAASFLISLMHHTRDDENLSELGMLLFNPLLLNYTGKTRDYVLRQREAELGKVKATLEQALQSIDSYLDDLKSIGNLNALHPGESQRETFYRYSSQRMENMHKAAEEKSLFHNLYSKSLLLYGRTSITYVYDFNGQPHRTLLPLQSHSFTIEHPRMDNIDPSGLDYILCIFRNERIKV